MLKKLTLSIVILAVISLTAIPELMAQGTTRVRFARGRNSATMRGSIGGYGGARHYVLRASAGQTLTATLSSGNGKVDFTQGSLHDTQYSETLQQNGDVYVDIDNHGARTTYTLTISIQ